MNKFQAGFTLIELLIAITIITIIGAVGMGSYNRSVARARDGKRISELRAIQKALELYYEDNDYYPVENVDYTSSQGKIGEGETLDGLLAPTYLRKALHDPRGPGNADFYYYFDENHWCDEADNTRHYVVVLFARQMEVVESNTSDLCPGGLGAEGQADEAGVYMIVLGDRET